jgi:hypothetical protein
MGGGVQMGPLSTVATNRPTVQPRVIMMMEKLVEWWAGETEVLKENLHAALSTTNPAYCPDANLHCCGGKLATNCLSYGMAFKYSVYWKQFQKKDDLM